jgi:hypothetical protein
MVFVSEEDSFGITYYLCFYLIISILTEKRNCEERSNLIGRLLHCVRNDEYKKPKTLHKQ